MDATFYDSRDKNLVRDFDSWFKAITAEDDILYGYVNNLYQSSIRPLAGYLNAIDAVMTENIKDGLKFHLPVELIWKVKTSTYYLAEYESAGIHMYDRHATLLPYIEQYILGQGAKIESASKKIPLQVGLFNKIRLWGVFFAKFLIEMKGIAQGRVAIGNNIKLEGCQVFLVRTIGQAITVLQYLKMTNLKTTLVVGDTYTDTGAFELLSKSIRDKKNISVVNARRSKISRVIKRYMKGFKSTFSQKKAIYKYKGLSIDFTQALKEVRVMVPGLELYQEKIKEQLEVMTPNRLFTFEQKSPHAFVDTLLARQRNIPSAQIQCCQQGLFDIPNPVSGDYFFCESPVVAQGFQNSWSRSKNNVKYIGTLQGIKGSGKETEEQGTRTDIKVCFFAGIEKDINDKIFAALSSFSKNHPIHFLVKIHPRDRENYSETYPNLEFIKTYKSSFSEFATGFDLAVTFPSGVVSDLLYTDTPFLVYTAGHINYIKSESEFLPKGMEPINDAPLLLDALLDVDKVKHRHENILNEFKESRGIITDISTIEKNFDKLLQ